MSQPKGKTNFKTYEASTRLLAAVIATAGPKLDYNEIARHVGGGVGVDAINHRFRPIKQLAKMQAACVKKGTDPGELPTDKGEIQKLFGESTPSGIEWQFRDIKNLGKAQQEAVKKGNNPATLLVPGTPSAGRGRGRPASTPGSGSTVRTPGTGTSTGNRGRKRNIVATLPPVESSDENGGADDNDSDFGAVETPSRRPTKRAATASAKKANGSATAPITTPAAAATPSMPVSRSIFGGGDARAQRTVQSAEAFGDDDMQMNDGHGAEDLEVTPRAAGRPATIKNEFAVSANTFLSSINPGSFDMGDFEDGEI